MAQEQKQKFYLRLHQNPNDGSECFLRLNDLHNIQISRMCWLVDNLAPLGKRVREKWRDEAGFGVIYYTVKRVERQEKGRWMWEIFQYINFIVPKFPHRFDSKLRAVKRIFLFLALYRFLSFFFFCYFIFRTKESDRRKGAQNWENKTNVTFSLHIKYFLLLQGPDKNRCENQNKGEKGRSRMGWWS